MKKRAWAFCLAFCLAVTSGWAALADWSSSTARLADYTAVYGDAAESYKAIRYGAESAQVAAVKTSLSSLGYFPFAISNNYNRSLERAARLFATQMRIGGDGREITPLMQAMLADAANLPPAISPVINTTPYTSDPDSGGYVPYTYARVSRTNVREDTHIGFDGTITAWTREGDTCRYAVQMENDPQKVLYVTYRPLPRTTVFQPGDRVSVLGVTQGLASYPYPGMTNEALTVAADRVGYTPQ